jgi:alpha-galactosidase
MKKNYYLLFLAILFLGQTANAGTKRDDAKAWLLQVTDHYKPALSFTLGGEPSSKVFARSNYKTEPITDKRGWKGLRSIYDDPQTGLHLTIEAYRPTDMQVVEWTCYLENLGKENTPILHDIQAVDLPVNIKGDKKEPYDIFYSQGTHSSFDDFSLHDSIVGPQATIDFVARGGESSSAYLPFFNINRKDNGVIVGIGWTGQWKATFRMEGNKVSLRAGMEHTNVVLYPGEKIRTPLISLLFWEGNKVMAQNQLRRYIVKYASPRPGGKDMKIPVSFASWGGTPASKHLEYIRLIKQLDLGYDNYWIDAGWFGGPHETEAYQDHRTEDWYGRVGDWRMNTTIHPQGLRPVSDAAHAAGLRFLLWFEPERVIGGNLVSLEHPEWMLKLPSTAKRSNVGKWKQVESMLINMGNPEARKWITDFIASHIRDNRIDILRIDANVSELKYWKAADSSERIGMTEIKYVEGLYQFLDDLLAEFPNLLIDNCAGGGNRLDLEMLRRSVALHRSDYVCWSSAKPVGCQLQAFSIMNWIPYSNTGTSVKPYDAYKFRSNMNAGLNFNFLPRGENGEFLDAPKDYPWDWFRKMMHEHNDISDCYNGDYFPLTAFSKEETAWCAYQLYRKDLEKGFVLAFRREQAPQSSIIVQLGDIDRKAVYDLYNYDLNKHEKVSGKALLKGYQIVLDKPRSSVLLRISREK